jgi:hypothetical protein
MTTQPAPNTTRIVAANVRGQLASKMRTQTELGDALGIGQRGVAARLAGSTRWSLDDLIGTARFLGVPLSAIAPDSLTED